MSTIADARMKQLWRETILRRYPEASLLSADDGGHVIVVPVLHVEGYQAPTISVSFEVPVGFPFACPADFTTNPIRLKSGAWPSHTVMREDGSAVHWYHRLMYWNPQRDSLINYWGSILRRINSAPAALAATPEEK